MEKATDKISIQEMPQIEDRVTFIYVEHALINRQDGDYCIGQQGNCADSCCYSGSSVSWTWN